MEGGGDGRDSEGLKRVEIPEIHTICGGSLDGPIRPNFRAIALELTDQLLQVQNKNEENHIRM